MPHKVAPFAFFRSHTTPLLDLQEPKKPKPSHTSSSYSRPFPPDRSSSTSSSSINLDRSARMPDFIPKRLSLSNIIHSPKSSSKSIPLYPPATLSVVIESPPLIFLGTAASSSGALFSGQLKLDIQNNTVAIDCLKLKLVMEVTRKRPFHNHCQECAHQTEELHAWPLLEAPMVLQKGIHHFPFSCVLKGSLPASMKGSLSTIEYVLKGTMVPKTGEPMKLSQILNVKRAIIPPHDPRSSKRVFPPTELIATCNLPTVIHPIGVNTLSMSMDGVVKRNYDTKTQVHWKLKHLTWKLDEIQKDISEACPKHTVKIGGEKKAMSHQETRTIGTEEIKSGWKSDFGTSDGNITLEFPFSIRPGTNPVCDTKTENGTEVTHVLVLEMIVGEEYAPLNKPKQVTPTGAARVLRMHFNVTLSERAGLGISWDEEQPPLYGDVPPSPPHYINNTTAELYNGPPIPDYALDDPAESQPTTPTLSDRILPDLEGVSPN